MVMLNLTWIGTSKMRAAVYSLECNTLTDMTPTDILVLKEHRNAYCFQIP